MARVSMDLFSLFPCSSLPPLPRSFGVCEGRGAVAFFLLYTATSGSLSGTKRR